jgi:hypothetical protein
MKSRSAPKSGLVASIVLVIDGYVKEGNGMACDGMFDGVAKQQFSPAVLILLLFLMPLQPQLDEFIDQLWER